MVKQEEMLYGAVRRRESLRLAQKQPHEALPSFLTHEDQDSSKDPTTILANDLASLEMKKADTLKAPSKGEIKVGKMPSLILLIALSFMAALFFVVGFLTCYSLFPPYGGFSLTSTASKMVSSTPASTMSEALVPNPTPSYSIRQQQIAKAAGRKVGEPSLVEQAEQQTLAEAKFQAQSAVGQVLNNATSKLRDTLGSKLGGIVAPLTTGIAQTLAQQETNQAFEKVNEKIGGESTRTQNTLAVTDSKKNVQPEDAHHQKATSSTQIAKNLYTIHVRDFSDQSTAQEYVNELKKRGFTECYYSRLWGAQGIVYAVKAGQYKTFQEALSASKILREQGGQLTRIVPMTSNDLTPTAD